MSDPVRLDIAQGIATITLARPEKLNALDDVMVGLLGRFADTIDADRSVRAVILTAEGKAFCAGGDIAGMKERLKAPHYEAIFRVSGATFARRTAAALAD